jgi:hypothetical protein
MDEEAMEDELQQWMKEHRDSLEIQEVEESHEQPVSGKCTICEVRDAKYRCLKCGKAVCSSCYVVMFGLCERCISPAILKKIRDSKKDYGIDRIK